MAVIAHLANFYGPRSGGLRTTIHQLARQYADHGHLVHVIVPGPHDRTVLTTDAVIHEIGAPTIPGSGGYRAILRMGAVRRVLEQARPDAIELSDRTTLLPVAAWARSRGIRVTFIAHERVDGVLHAFAPRLPALPLANRWNRATAARVDQVVATTTYAAAEFARIGVPVTAVPLGVDITAFGPRRANPHWRRQFPAGPLLVLASRLSREKRPEFTLDVLRSCLRLGMDAHLVVLGDGPLRSSMQQAATGLPTTFLGFVSDRSRVAEILASADIAMAPGPIETFGLAALESMASGTPVIANEDSALAEILSSGGGQVCPLEADAWARAAADLLSDDGVGDRARMTAERYSWEATAQRMLAAHDLAAPRTSTAS